MKSRFSHAYTVAFELESAAESAKDVTPLMLRAALLQRIINLDEEDAWIEACGAPYDTYELEA